MMISILKKLLGLKTSEPNPACCCKEVCRNFSGGVRVKISPVDGEAIRKVFADGSIKELISRRGMPL